MTERPILFSGPMVRALLAGTKTQTRRVVRDGVVVERRGDDDAPWPWDALDHVVRCPFGLPGDRLWVREAWAWDGAKSRLAEYRATWECRRDAPGVRCEHGPARWRTSIHMPRWASRITLEVTGVRVERLFEISEADAKAEGVESAGGFMASAGCWTNYGSDGPSLTTARESYVTLWESINGPDSWAINPWVWCVSFRRL